MSAMRYALGRAGTRFLAKKSVGGRKAPLSTEALSEGNQRVKSMQEYFNKFPNLHGVDNPTYLKKGSTDAALFSGVIGGVVVGFLVVVKGLVSALLVQKDD
eukprot:385327_1